MAHRSARRRPRRGGDGARDPSVDDRRRARALRAAERAANDGSSAARRDPGTAAHRFREEAENEALSRKIERLERQLARITKSFAWRLVITQRPPASSSARSAAASLRAPWRARSSGSPRRPGRCPGTRTPSTATSASGMRSTTAISRRSGSPPSPGSSRSSSPSSTARRSSARRSTASSPRPTRRFEVIAVDDGSTDASGRILDEVAARDARVLVLHQPNRKLPAALSAGFRRARGQYLTWISADNRLAPEFLARMVDELSAIRRGTPPGRTRTSSARTASRSAARPGTPAISGRPVAGTSTSRSIPPSSTPGRTTTCGASFLYRDRVAALLGDYSRFRFGTEDYDYWMRVNDS